MFKIFIVMILCLVIFSYRIRDVNSLLMKCPTYLQKFQKTIGYRPPTEFLTKESLASSENSFHASDSNLLNPTCWNICQIDENCIGYVLSISTFECFGVSIFGGNDVYEQKLVSDDFLIADSNAIYFQKVCLTVPEGCNHKFWIITVIPGNSLMFQGKKTLPTLITRKECAEKCLHEREFPCLSASFAPSHKNNRNRFFTSSEPQETIGRCILSDKDKIIQPDAYRAAPYGEEYIENQCYDRPVENDNCSYEIYSNSTFVYSEQKYDGLSQKECQNKCSHEQRFYCQGVSYYLDSVNPDISKSECYLHSEDLISMGPRSIQFQLDSIYMRRVKCLDVTVTCNREEMTIKYTPKSWFRGKLYVSSYSSSCYVEGNGTMPTVLHLQIGNEVKEKRCGILRAYEVKDNYKRIFITTLLVVQHNQNVQTQGDRLIRVGCILTNIQSEKTAGIAEAQMGLLPSEGSITVNSNSMQLPKITMQIIDLNDRYETNDVQIGQNLEMQILAEPANTPYDYEVTSLTVKSNDQNTTVNLIDENGCPVDTTIFPALEKSVNPERNMLSTKFHAFKFAEGQIVSFDVKVRFCLFKCPIRNCTRNGHRKKRQSNLNQQQNQNEAIQVKNPLYVSWYGVDTGGTQLQENEHDVQDVDGQQDDEKQAAESELLGQIPRQQQKILDIELPLNYKLHVHGPHKYVDSNDAMIYGENGRVVFVSGIDPFSSEQEKVCVNQSLLIAILIFWIIFQIILIMCCCYVVQKYRKFAYSSENTHKSFSESFEDYEISRRVHWADQGGGYTL